MNRKIIFIILLLTSNISFGQDTLRKVNNLEIEIANLKNQNLVLTDKIEMLNSVNDKILNSIYWTIGTILAVLIGLNLYSSIKNQKFNEKKFTDNINSSKRELELSLSEMLNEKIKNISIRDIANLKSTIKQTQDMFFNLKEQMLIDKIPSHPHHKLFPESEHIMTLMRFVPAENTYSCENFLECLKTFIIKEKRIYHKDRTEILQLLDEDFSADRYKYQVADIKKLLETIETY